MCSLLFQRGCDSSIVFLFDKSLNKYSGPLTARPLPDSVNFIGKRTPKNMIFIEITNTFSRHINYRLLACWYILNGWGFTILADVFILKMCSRSGYFVSFKVSFLWICVSVRETKTQLPLTALRKVWGEAVSYICGLKEDYIRLYRGQRAAM